MYLIFFTSYFILFQISLYVFQSSFLFFLTLSSSLSFLSHYDWNCFLFFLGSHFFPSLIPKTCELNIIILRIGLRTLCIALRPTFSSFWFFLFSSSWMPTLNIFNDTMCIPFAKWSHMLLRFSSSFIIIIDSKQASKQVKQQQWHWQRQAQCSPIVSMGIFQSIFIYMKIIYVYPYQSNRKTLNHIRELSAFFVHNVLMLSLEKCEMTKTIQKWIRR